MEGRSALDGTAQELAYEHALRAVDQQAGILDNIRARAGTLIAVTSLVATFLGARALDQPAPHAWINWLALVPLTAFAASLGFSISVLMPTSRERPDGRPRTEHRGLRFTLSAHLILERAMTRTEDDEPLRVEVARNLQDNWDNNDAYIDAKLDAFKHGAWALMAQVVLWTLLLVVKEVN